MAAAVTGLFLIFTMFTAPLYSMVSFTPIGGYMQQASAQAQSTTTPPQRTLPFTPFSLQQQQQEAVPEEEGGGEGEPIQGPGVPPSPLLLTNDTGTGATTTPATNDTAGGGEGGLTELTSSSSSSTAASEPPLRVQAIANATEAYAPATIRLDANITGGAPPYSYNWYVPGFGVIDQDRSITQMFFEPGTFNYILTVTDSRGKVLNDNVHIVIYERLSPPGGEGVTVAPEPGGVAPPEEPIQGPGVPPPTVGEGGDTGRGPQGGVTVGEGGGPIQEPGTPPPRVPEGQGGGGISIGEGGFVLIPNATSGYVGDRFELQIYIRDNIEIEHPIFIFCLSHVPQNDGTPSICNTAYYVQDRADCDLSGIPPPGYRAFDCVGAFWYSTPGTHRIIFGTDTRNIGSTQITIKEQPPQGGAVAPEPGGVAPPEEGGGLGVPPSLLPNNTGTRATTTTATNDTVTPAECPPGQFFNATSGQCELLVGEDVVAPEPGGVAPPEEGIPPPTIPEPEGIAPPEIPIQEPRLIVEIITNATQAVGPGTFQAYAPATIRLDANITGGAPPYSYTWLEAEPGVEWEAIDQDRSITQMFFEPGTFGYYLYVTDSMGQAASDSIQITVEERPGGVLPPPETGGEGQPPGALFSPPGTVPPPSNDTGEVVSAPTEEGGESPPSTTGGGEEPSPPPPPPDDTGGESPPDEEPTTPPGDDTEGEQEGET